MDLSQFPGNLAPARLFLRQIFTYVPDIKTPPTPELFFYKEGSSSLPESSSSTTLKTSSNVVFPKTTSIKPD